MPHITVPDFDTTEELISTPIFAPIPAPLIAFQEFEHDLIPDMPLAEIAVIINDVVTDFLEQPHQLLLARSLRYRQIESALQTLQNSELPCVLANIHESGFSDVTLMYYYHHTDGHYYVVNFHNVVSLDSAITVTRDY